MVVLSKTLNLLLVEVHIREQASLHQNMIPGAGSMKLMDEEMVQSLPDPDHTITRCLYFLCPLSEQVSILHDDLCKSRSVSWRR